MLKIAEVSQVDYGQGQVKVRIPDRDNVETNWLAMLGFEYEMPLVNDMVRVNLDDGDYTNGICLGRYYNDTYPPVKEGPTTYYKRLLGDLVIEYDSGDGTLTITADKIVVNGEVEVNGDVRINGDLAVVGDIDATGAIIDAGGNTNHHEH